MENIFSKDSDFAAGVIIPVDKPLGWTSTDVVRRVKALLGRMGHRKIKVGHAGTLDPLATGVLIVCIGKATKMVESLQAEEKEYVAGITIGATTPSFDMEHPVDARYPWEHITRGDVETALASLCGERLQTPPVYSAKMIDGRRSYEYAREGSEVALRQSLITIHSMDILKWEPPLAEVRIACSKGTYVRSIAMELGQALGCGAYLSSLCRTRSGNFTVQNTYTMDQITTALK